MTCWSASSHVPISALRKLSQGVGGRAGPTVTPLFFLSQVIDCSMAVQEEPKEPHVSSVLPWIILHRIIWQEEDTFHSLCHQQQFENPTDEGGRKWVRVGGGP